MCHKADIMLWNQDNYRILRDFLFIPWLEKEENHLTQCQLEDKGNDATSITFGF